MPFVYNLLVKIYISTYNRPMKDLWNYLKTAKKPILLYGMGNGADKIISVLDGYGIKISGVFVSDGFVRKKTFHGFEILDYATAKSRFGDMIVLVCFGTSLADVIGNIKNIAAEQELYAPDVAVYGGVLFNAEYVAENREKLEKVYNMLADDVSKKVFENAVKYKLSGKIEYLFECETPLEEVYENVLKFTADETYYDLGAYRGDTVEEFLSHVNGYEKIIAVEPDFKTYNKLCVATSNLKNIENINACVSDTDGEALFNMQSSRGSAISGGGNSVKSVTIDELSKKAVPTYIKMDIEGAELQAIDGAADVISRFKPKMQIAAYHRSEDLFALPLRVLSLRQDYKIYLRHFPVLPCWDTSYYFI